MKAGYYSDAYFNFARETLIADGRHPRVVTQVFQKHASVLGGMDEAIAILELCSHGFGELEVKALYDGDEIAPWETVMTIEGDYTLFAHLETVYLGVLARRTLISIERPAGRRRGERQADPLLSRPARPPPRPDGRRLRRPRRGRNRRVHRRAVVVVGRQRHRHRAARADRGLRRRHGAGRTALRRLGAGRPEHRRARRLRERLGADVARGRRALGDRLWGVRLDTSRTLVDRSLWDELGDFDPRGVNERLVLRVREALDREGFEGVRIVVSGGFDVERIREFEATGVPVDSYGVGSTLIRGENDFTADVVVVDGVPCAKVGRRLRPNPRLAAGRVGPTKARRSGCR